MIENQKEVNRKKKEREENTSEKAIKFKHQGQVEILRRQH